MEATAVQNRIKKTLNTGLSKMTKMSEPMEKAALKISPSLYVAFGFDCCIAATGFALAKKHQFATIMGTWASFSLLLGIYAKLSEHDARM